MTAQACRVFGPGELMKCPGARYGRDCDKGLGWVGPTKRATVCVSSDADPDADETRECSRCGGRISLNFFPAIDNAK